MKKLEFIIAICALAVGQIDCESNEIICYYDADSFDRTGDGHFALDKLEVALPSCDYLVYGYIGIDPITLELRTLNAERDLHNQHFFKITQLKKKYPQVRFLLSVGGDKDSVNENMNMNSNSNRNQYLKVLETPDNREAFVNCSVRVVKYFGFDGFDMAWQFPKNSAEGFDKRNFIYLVRDLRASLQKENLLLTLTMLPNVKADKFIDIPHVINYVDFVNLALFDFHTPYSSPNRVEYPAPLYQYAYQGSNIYVQSIVSDWVLQSSNTNKLVLGIPLFGRAWSREKNSPAPGGRQTQTPGLLSWPEICELKSNCSHCIFTKDPAVRDSSASVANGDIWVGYECPESARMKAMFAKGFLLRGVALFDLSLDDFKNVCGNGTFSILQNIRDNFGMKTVN